MIRFLSCVWAAFLLLFISASRVQADDAGILYDISRSIKNETFPSSRAAVKDLLLKGTVHPEWEISSVSKGDVRINRLLESKKALISRGDKILIMEFGAILSPSFPYFKPPSVHDFTTIKNAQDFLDQKLPKASKDWWTHKDLPEAVASKYFQDLGRKAWYFIIVSDFNRDVNVALSEEQQKLTDDYLTQKDFSVSTSLILRWEKDRRLQIRVKKVIPKAKPLPQDPLTLVTPPNKAKLENNKPTFAWRWNAQESPKNYRLIVTHKNRRKIMVSRQVSLPRYVSTKPLVGGSYEWYVIAFLDNRNVRSSRYIFKIKGGNILSWLILILAMAGGSLSFYRYALPWLRNRMRRKER